MCGFDRDLPLNGMKRTLLKTLYGSLFLLLPAMYALAQEIVNPIQAQSFTDIINAIANFAMLIVTPISVIVILYAGVLFMFSGGDVEKVKKAKHALLWAVVGLAIVLTGRGLIYIIQDVLRGGQYGGGF